MFADFETLMDPSRNHRVYRLTVAKLSAPIIPFMPLLMKGKEMSNSVLLSYYGRGKKSKTKKMVSHVEVY